MILNLIIFLVVVIVLIGIVYSKTKAGPKRTYKVDLSDKIIIITGSSAGVGKETARKMASRGATVIFACRNKEKTLKIINEIQLSTKNNKLHFIELNLPDYNSVRNFVKEFQQRFDKIDILINNAGIFLIHKQFNDQNHELMFSTNHLGHFLLTNLLIQNFTSNSRIINVSSGAHTFLKTAPDFEQALIGGLGSGMNVYATTKFANILFTQELAQRLQDKNQSIKVVALHPGFVRSEIYHNKNGANKYLSLIVSTIIDLFLRQFSLSEEEGSRTSEYCALQDYEELVNGGYYEKNQYSKSSTLTKNCKLEERLWNLSKNAVKL